MGDPRDFEAVYETFAPDLILLDVSMPYRDGFQILEGLKRLSPDSAPLVLILTAHPNRELRLRLLASGANDFLLKPFDMLEVLVRVRILLEVRILRRILFLAEQEREK